MRTRSGQHRRRGILSMELVFTLPILLFMLLGVFEFSLLFYARGTVVEACRAGARTATHPGTSQEAIEQAVLLTLGPQLGQRVEIIAELGEHAGDPVAVAIRVPMSSASPDLLWPIGFSLQGRTLAAEAVMRRE